MDVSEPVSVTPGAPAAFPFDGVRLRIDAWPITESGQTWMLRLSPVAWFSSCR